MENEIQISPVETNAIQLQTDAPPMVQVAQLLASGVDIDVDKMAKIQEMSERYDAGKARTAFFTAMSVAQSEIEGVFKNKKNAQTNSRYADLAGVIEVAKPIYTKHGFSVTYSEGKADTEGYIRVCADVMHKDGHEKQYHYDLEIDDKGIKGSVNKTSIHGKASSVSYCRRYLMCMIWNISTPDDDGNVAEKPKPEIKPPNDEQKKCIKSICEKLPPKDGYRIDATKVGLFFLREKGAYPSTIKRVGDAAEFVVQKNPQDIYVKESA